MIGSIRSYIKSKVSEIDSDLKHSQSAFYNGDIPETTLENTYQIELNNFSQVLREGYNQADVVMVLRIFGTGARNEVENYDCLFDKAIEIRDNIINLKSLDPNIDRSFLINAVSGDIEAQTIDGDDNTFQFIINFTLTVAYTTEG